MGGRTRRARHSRRHHRRQRGGNSCAAQVPGGAQCNAGSSNGYAVAMVGDAFTQMKQAMSSMFA